MSVKTTTVYRGPGYPVDPAREELRMGVITWLGNADPNAWGCEKGIFGFAASQIRWRMPVPIRPVFATELLGEGRLQRRDTLVYELVPFSEMVSECDPGDITRVGPCIPPRTRDVRFSQINDPMSWGLSRTIRRVETIVNFKDEFGFGLRPDWNECAYPEEIWKSYERIKAKGK